MLKYDGMNTKAKTANMKKENSANKFTWIVISKAPENLLKHKALEAILIRTICPTLNEQLDSDILALFRNFITQI